MPRRRLDHTHAFPRASDAVGLANSYENDTNAHTTTHRDAIAFTFTFTKSNSNSFANAHT